MRRAIAASSASKVSRARITTLASVSASTAKRLRKRCWSRAKSSVKRTDRSPRLGRFGGRLGGSKAMPPDSSCRGSESANSRSARAARHRSRAWRRRTAAAVPAHLLTFSLVVQCTRNPRPARCRVRSRALDLIGIACVGHKHASRRPVTLISNHGSTAFRRNHKGAFMLKCDRNGCDLSDVRVHRR